MSDEILILLSKYLHGDLSPAEKEAIEARILAEPAVAEALKELTLSEQSIQAKGDQLLKAKLDQKGHKLMQNRPQKSLKLWPWIAAAAAIALLFSLYFLNPFSQGPQWQEMAEAFPLPSTPTSVRDNLDLPQKRQKGSEQYLKLQNRAAINHWRPYLQDTSDVEIQFYIGIAYWQIAQHDSAQYFLSQVPQASSLYQRASWYQVALCVDSKDIDCLKTQLSNISQQNGHYKQSTAQEWLKQLE
ncbi:MAG: hypothetical protein AB8H47_19645 [Bacteroidia bacterium]